MVADTSINGKRVSQILERFAWVKGLPEVNTLDNRPKFTGKVLRQLGME